MAGGLHRLPIGQDRHAVGVGEIVGMTDCLLGVTLIAEIVPRDPGARGTVSKTSIAEMQSVFDGAEIGLGPCAQAPARVLRIQIFVQHAACHVALLSKPQAAQKQLDAQRMPNIPWQIRAYKDE